MNLPPPHFLQAPDREIPAIVRSLPREDVVWNRPVFKAPPLIVAVPTADKLFAGFTAATVSSGR